LPEERGREASTPPSSAPGPERPGGAAAKSGKAEERGREALALAAAAGDRHALDDLLDQHVDLVHAVCCRIVGHSEDALDAAQEALLAIAHGIGRFDGRSAFSTWAYRVATNAALDELRRRKRRPVTGIAGDVGDPEGERSAGGRGSLPPMSEPTAAVDTRLDVDAALEQVPDEFRVAVVLRDLADLDYAEIAAVLDVPLGTVKSRVARGRAALRAALGNSAGVAGRPSEHP
jgi:RNA polymerase sigma-70 factor (ECF subfamily)